MAIKSTLPLYERVHLKNRIPRAVELLILSLLISLLAYHLISLKQHGIPTLLAFLCESCFAFCWILVINCKWNQVKYIPYTDRLSKVLVTTSPVACYTVSFYRTIFFVQLLVMVIGTHSTAPNIYACFRIYIPFYDIVKTLFII